MPIPSASYRFPRVLICRRAPVYSCPRPAFSPAFSPASHSSNSCPRRRYVVGGWVEWGSGTGRGGWRGQAWAPRSSQTSRSMLSGDSEGSGAHIILGVISQSSFTRLQLNKSSRVRRRSCGNACSRWGGHTAVFSGRASVCRGVSGRVLGSEQARHSGRNPRLLSAIDGSRDRKLSQHGAAVQRSIQNV